MRVLIVHNDAEYLAGAEKMLGYYLEGFVQNRCQVALAVVRGAKVLDVVPDSIPRIYIPEKQRFSTRQLWRQARTIIRGRLEFPFDLLHAWTAREWELASLASLLTRRPAVGTLHDHPRARFITPKRQRLMRWCAAWGLRRVICVSEAVRSACLASGYPRRKLTVIHNGLPESTSVQTDRGSLGNRIGFLGMFSERKGLRGLFVLIERLAGMAPQTWDLFIAGGAQDSAGERLASEIQREYGSRPWWSKVHWTGWAKNPEDFLRGIDLLVVPSSEFDPFPTVLLEAGRAELPVVAARVGGVEEIVQDGKTGLLFEPGAWDEGAKLVAQLLAKPSLGLEFGGRAFRRVRDEFNAVKMVAKHVDLYSTLALHD